MPVINYIAIESEERVTATVSVKSIKDPGYLTMITRMGEIKRTEMAAFSNIRSNGLMAFDIEEGDDLCWVLKTSGDDDVLLVTREGQSIRFPETEARGRGRAAGGVKAVRFKEGNPEDCVVSAAIAREGSTLLVVGSHGFGKRTAIEEYRVQGRGGSGILTMNVTDKTGAIIGAEVVDEDDKLMLLTEKGKAIRMAVKDIRVTGRVAQGVKLISLGAGDRVTSIARVVKEADDGEIETAAAEGEVEAEATEE